MLMPFCSVWLPDWPHSFLLSCCSVCPASSASALQPGLLFLPVLCSQFSASITSVIFTAWGTMCQAKGRGSRHRQGTWGWSWTWQMPLPLPQGQAHPRMGHPPLPLQVDIMTVHVLRGHVHSGYMKAWSWFCHEAAGPLAHDMHTYNNTLLA